MKKIGICGHFAFGKNCLDGQTVKTQIVMNELEKVFGREQIDVLDTAGAKTNIPGQIIQLLKLLKKCENVIILPAHNGVRVFAPILAIANKFRKKKLHYIVIGGWLPEFVQKRRWLAIALKKFDYIYAETKTMKEKLERQGFTNIVLMPNCKYLHILKSEELVFCDAPPYKLCTFSRVMKEKGIETAINAVKIVNEKAGKTVYTLDIYGQIDINQTEWFENLEKSFPEYIHYCGCVPFDKSVDVLRNYFALLFLTHFYTEGIPGTVIDAYAAGIPVICSKWESCGDVVDIGKTGLVYDFDDFNALITLLTEISGNIDMINKLRTNCLDKAKQYTPESVMPFIIGRLNEKSKERH